MLVRLFFQCGTLNGGLGTSSRRLFRAVQDMEESYTLSHEAARGGQVVLESTCTEDNPPFIRPRASILPGQNCHVDQAADVFQISTIGGTATRDCFCLHALGW